MRSISGGLSEFMKRTLSWHELHISRESRDKYQFNETLFSQHGDVIFSDYHTVRRFVQQMNDRRNLAEYPERAVNSGDINGMGLIHEIFHYMIYLYREEKNSRIMDEAYEYLTEELGEDRVQRTLEIFTDQFPPVEVYRRELSPEEYLTRSSGDGKPAHRMLEELILLWLSNTNPAFGDYLELFDDTTLEKATVYPEIAETLQEFFDDQPFFGPEYQNLLDMLRSPAEKVPHSIPGQLDWIREHWGSMLGKHFYRLLRGLDLLREEQKLRFHGAGPSQPYEFGGDGEYERFSKDQDWMPRVVLLAKNVYVWLHQLSKRYQREIHRLDQIPDEELDTLAERGFTGLWLIGLWERSEASKRIKQMCGNPEAVASAYSLYDYVIADELGGQEAYENLRNRARSSGIRLSGDMVPNHVGIDGKWVTEHPDWFVGLDHPPYPSYSFNGPDLCPDDSVGIFLEDHYYERSDAAVVFKRVDHDTGEERFIYHGNDGTSMPWNDTAQLNYLKEEVREAVIQTILHVARNFDIIRFDAAMTLAKKHYQRLWFPEPGTGGDIPTRAEHGMTREEFDRVFPKEFWREVVDRVADEEPDTLLLAEAFWLMEGYFVRTLGMHRVYNSAFMNMMKNEDNAKYRQTIKNVLEFNPQILKRFVNFMNNPDEETALAQFGKDDKYFGTAVMMVTMPGLPMFGHGQIEGYREKYGMEYKRAYWDEQPDEQLIARHRREVFPLLHKRYLFADVENFLFYDFYTTEGGVNEDVFAYSNRSGDERCLVLYNNRFQKTRGWIHTSTAYADKTGSEQENNLVQKHLGEGLGITNDGDHYTIFRDHITGLEYIRNSRTLYEDGLFVELGAFKYHVFLEFREVEDTNNIYSEIHEYLDGRGVPSIEEALRETLLKPIHEASRDVLSVNGFNSFIEAIQEESGEGIKRFTNDLEEPLTRFVTEIKEFTNSTGDVESVVREITGTMQAMHQLSIFPDGYDSSLSSESPEMLSRWKEELENGDHPLIRWFTLYVWSIVRSLGQLVPNVNTAQQSRTWIEELHLGKLITGLLPKLEISQADAEKTEAEIKLLTAHQQWFEKELEGPYPEYQLMHRLLNDRIVRNYLELNRYQETLWFGKEPYDELCFWLHALAIVDYLQIPADERSHEILDRRHQIIGKLSAGEEQSNYQVEQLLDVLKSD